MTDKAEISKPKNYLFFYLKTGGGHLAPARAVSEKIKLKDTDTINIVLADGLSGASVIARGIIEDGYKSSLNNAKWIFEFLYFLNKCKPIASLTVSLVAFFIKPVIERQILTLKPDKIVLFHFFIIKPVYEIVEKYKLNIPVVTVVTDPFTAHPVWFLRKDQKFIIFSEMLKEKCIKSGIEEERLKVFPFVLDRQFSRQISRIKAVAIRQELGFRIDSKIILIIGGGEGMPKGKKIIKKIIAANVDAEVAVVCGRNKKMKESISKFAEKSGARNIKIYGHIDFVYSLIGISDFVITKCGASTFMEILLMGKIPIINNYIWEQEKGNMEYICKSNMGILEKKLHRIPALVTGLINNNELRIRLSENIKKADLRNGVDQVSEYILGL